jgi:hypothetical protein
MAALVALAAPTPCPKALPYAILPGIALWLTMAVKGNESRGNRGFPCHKPLNGFNILLTELNIPVIVQTVMARDKTVRAIATTPIIFDFLSSCSRYFQANQSPNGATKKLTK